MNNLLLKMSECYKDPRGSALCIITASRGSGPGKLGAKMIVYSDGTIEGTVGGGEIELQVIQHALQAIRDAAPQSKEYDLHADLNMSCGGKITVYIEPMNKPARLYIFGAGHIGKVVARYAPDMGFDTTLIDWRKDIFENPGNLNYTQLCKPYLEAVQDLQFDSNTYCVIVTPNHEMDEEILAVVAKKSTAYVGMIGSKTKIAVLTKKFLAEKILTEEELAKVNMPIGIKFNAVTPAEIAVSIVAKLVDVKNSKGKE